MPDHRYHQYCALARALDVAGDRWTPLVVRELVPGPRRFTDLLDGLPGVSRNLLTERLRDLEREGVVARQELPPPAARQVYALTDDGRDLATALAPLIAWGARRLGERAPTDSFRPRWAAVGMSVVADRQAAAGVHEAYQLVVGRSAFHFVVDDGTIEVRDGHADHPAVTLATDDETWAQIVAGTLTPSAAVERGALAVQGSRAAVSRFAKIFSPPRRTRRRHRSSGSTSR